MRTWILLGLVGCSRNAMLGGEGGSNGESDDGGVVIIGEDGEPVDEEVECDEVEAKPLFLSPDDSNSMASPVLVREGGLSAGVRVWEFLNYYSFDYAAAPEGEVALDLQLRETDEPGVYDFQIGIASPAVTNETRPQMNLVFSIDASGSMSGRPTELVRHSLERVASMLVAGDVVSIVTWDDGQNVVLANHTVSGPDDPDFLARIDDISGGGSTNLSAGLEEGYALAAASYDPSRVNRVFLLSDGGANLGETDAKLIGEHAADANGEGIYMVGVGIGGGWYEDGLMDTVTDLGKGASLFIPSEEEADKMFGERFVSTVGVAARDVQVELHLPSAFSVVQFSGEEMSTDESVIEPQHLAPDDAMVFYQQLEACAEDAITDDLEIEVIARWIDPVTFEERSTTQTVTVGELLGADASQLSKGAATYWTAKALYDAAQGGDTASVSMRNASVALEAAAAIYPDDLELAELEAMLNSAR